MLDTLSTSNLYLRHSRLRAQPPVAVLSKNKQRLYWDACWSLPCFWLCGEGLVTIALHLQTAAWNG